MMRQAGANQGFLFVPLTCVLTVIIVPLIHIPNFQTLHVAHGCDHFAPCCPVLTGMPELLKNDFFLGKKL